MCREKALNINIAYEEKYIHDGESDEYVFDSTRRYAAFPVIITNKSDSLMLFGMFNTVMQWYGKQRTKTETGYKLIKRSTGLCGTGARDLFLEPGDIAIAKLRRYKGSFRTECRLRLGRVYSNTFVDYVDERQFQFSDAAKVSPVKTN